MIASPFKQALLEQPRPDTLDLATPISVLATILEGFSDGVLLLTDRGECLQVNCQGRRLCRLLSPNQAVPSEVWSLCEKLIEGRSLLPDINLVLSDTVTSAAGSTISIRAQWIEFGGHGETCLLVMMEDQTQTAKVSALLESRQYNLTPRETEVWLLRKTNCSYDEIAARLFIALNTVKRHLKSIYAKRKQVLEE
ncbi:helix-turn-helix transcriptional regulator [Pseudanabaena sp. FACHB-2040]|uniref:helix-turn-helix transcriptional regulator n=1 Tax=Pseudanabaena sp. FACHB-2040 TaxID=2692859 RepID=UPI0016866A78|nr:helix-turn-helix transcriptional regulator [Pseudanabaena sp. FACHB-2040]MBD2256812.1 helix-turn-helix transcriptional regulator [Pseudanabaena sp. FACHB-2040]